MSEAERIAMPLQDADSLPKILTASFESFELIRLLARQYQDRMPSLFAAFMSTADAAVDGREAVTIAPSLPTADASSMPLGAPAASAGLDQVIETLAALGAQLDERLTAAITMTASPGDRAACTEAADAARRIHQLMARGDDDTGLR
jgi:hypothetical protein